MSISKAEFLRTLQRYKAAQDNALSGVTMPVAGASTLGCVKVGAGLSMVGDTLTVVWNNFSLGSASSTVEGAFWLEDDT